MMDNYSLNSPFMSITFDGRPPYFRLLFAAWMLLWAVVVSALLYGYAVVFKDLVGFETAVLVGIALAILSVGGSND